MKRITEAQIRQVIREEVVNLLNENLDINRISNELRRLSFTKTDVGDEDGGNLLKDRNGKCKVGYSYNNTGYAVSLDNNGICLHFYLSSKTMQLRAGQLANPSEESKYVGHQLEGMGLQNLVRQGDIPVRGA